MNKKIFFDKKPVGLITEPKLEDGKIISTLVRLDKLRLKDIKSTVTIEDFEGQWQLTKYPVAYTQGDIVIVANYSPQVKLQEGFVEFTAVNY